MIQTRMGRKIGRKRERRRRREGERERERERVMHVTKIFLSDIINVQMDSENVTRKAMGILTTSLKCWINQSL
jgi:hypothetical protein